MNLREHNGTIVSRQFARIFGNSKGLTFCAWIHDLSLTYPYVRMLEHVIDWWFEEREFQHCRMSWLREVYRYAPVVGFRAKK